MVKEGLPVYITIDKDGDIVGGTSARDHQYNFAVDHFGADIVLPVDADEFLININGGSPRAILESLEDDVEYRIQRRNYICPKEINDNTKFFPFYSDCYNAVSPLPKALTNRFLLKEKNAHVAVGAHSFFYPNIPNPPRVEEIMSICYNHYTIRNSTNLMTKIIPGWLNVLCTPGRDTGIRYYIAWNWRHIYDELKTTGNVSQESLEVYSLHNNVGGYLGETHTMKIARKNIKTISSNFDISFCEDKVKLRYTDYNANKKYFMQILLKQLETNLLNMASWRTVQEREVANEQIAFANYTISNLNNYIKLLKSRTLPSLVWRIGRKIVHIIRKAILRRK
jgi:hypothetical protein